MNIKSLYLLSCVAFSLNTLALSKTINIGWPYSENKTDWKIINITHTINNKNAFNEEFNYTQGLAYYQKQFFVASEEKKILIYLKCNDYNDIEVTADNSPNKKLD